MKKTSVFPLLAVLVAAVLACGQGTGLSSTRVPSRTPVPSPTATPTVKSVCVQVKAGDFSEEMAQVTKRLLTDLGLTVLPAGAACDASLSFDLTIEALSDYYPGLIGPGATCYTGAKATGTYTYAITGYSPRTVPVDEERPPISGYGTISYCPGPTEAPFAEVWHDVIIRTLNGIWGDEVFFAAARDEDEDIRAVAIRWLSTTSRENAADAERAMSVFLQAIQSDPSVFVRIAAADALESVGVEDERVLPALVEALRDEDRDVRAAAAENIGDLREDAVGAVPALIQVLQGPDSWMRYKAASALGMIGPGAVEAVPALILLLEDETELVRYTSAYTLGEIGPGAMQAVPALIQVLRGEETDMRHSAERALNKITGEDFGEDATLWQQWWEARK